jgi:hypothetical protein
MVAAFLAWMATLRPTGGDSYCAIRGKHLRRHLRTADAGSGAASRLGAGTGLPDATGGPGKTAPTTATYIMKEDIDKISATEQSQRTRDAPDRSGLSADVPVAPRAAGPV